MPNLKAVGQTVLQISPICSRSLNGLVGLAKCPAVHMKVVGQTVIQISRTKIDLDLIVQAHSKLMDLKGLLTCAKCEGCMGNGSQYITYKRLTLTQLFKVSQN